MLTIDKVREIAAAGESEVLELKRTTGEVRSALQTICAMLNQRGGRVLFGVEPDGRVVGQHVSERTLEEVASEVRKIDLPVTPAVERVSVEGGREVIVLTVTEGPSKPYTYDSRPYRRIANTTSQMSRDEYNSVLLERLHGERRWESDLAIDWSVSDLDPSEVTRVLEEGIRRGRVEEPGTRDTWELVRGLGLTKGGSLTRAAVMLFGRPERLSAEFPQCLLRVARFLGIDRTEFLDNRQYRGNAFALLRYAERYLREALPVAGRVLPGLFERVDDPLYPSIALREALANAICHRDYSIGGGSVALAIYDDRLEVTSSGMLHFGLTPQALYAPHESLPWNPLIASVFFRSGVIEQWGRGTLKMVELVEQAGLPPLEIVEGGGAVTVRFRPGRYLPPQRVARRLSERQRVILALLEPAVGGLALREIRATLPQTSTERQTREDLAALQQWGLVEAVGRGRGAKWHLMHQNVEQTGQIAESETPRTRLIPGNPGFPGGSN